MFVSVAKLSCSHGGYSAAALSRSFFESFPGHDRVSDVTVDSCIESSLFTIGPLCYNHTMREIKMTHFKRTTPTSSSLNSHLSIGIDPMTYK